MHKDESSNRLGETKRDLPAPRKGFATRLISENESIRLTNGLIALTVRLIISVILIVIRLIHGNRSHW